MTERVVEPEWMDDPSLDTAEHARALRGLERINRLSRSAAMFWPALRREAVRLQVDEELADESTRELQVVDFACGGGDVLIQLARLAKQRGMAVRWTGLDISETALRHARTAAARAGVDIDFVKRDVCASDAVHEVKQSAEAVRRYDVAISSLFLHHLDNETVTRVLTTMRRVSPCVLINDLRRGWLQYRVAWLGTRLLSRSPVVHVDGPQSVAAGWTPPELRALAEAAGLRGAAVSKRFPGRLLLDWREGDA